jgi:hypothetical protein
MEKHSALILIYNLCGRVIPVSFPLAELQELHKSLFEQRLESIIPGLLIFGDKPLQEYAS